MIVATPHHWHAPIVVRALNAGKHVYCEKPASHVFREGRLIVEAARRNKRVVQHGTQMRSSEVTAGAGKVLKSGVLIDVASGDRGDVTSVALTALWGVYGATVLVAGFFGGWRPVRLAGLGLLGVPVAKLFLVDSFQLEDVFKVAAFIIMGGILLAGGYLYQRHNTAFKDFFLDTKGQTADA